MDLHGNSCEESKKMFDRTQYYGRFVVIALFWPRSSAE